MELRPYQAEAKTHIYAGWHSGHSNVLAVLPTGSGKTVILAEVVKEHSGASCVIAHRQELVSQISIALARDGVRHKIIGPKPVIREIVSLHMQELGMSFYNPASTCAVAGVDTLVRRNGTGFEGDYYYQVLPENRVLKFGPRTNGRWPECGAVDCAPAGALSGAAPPQSTDPAIAQWCNSVTLWIQDEAHHLVKDNKWGTAAAMFPNAKGLGVTATPLRADGKGLGRHADGVFDQMIVGPSMRDLINMEYLTEYRVFAPPSDLDLHAVPTSKATGDYNPNKLKTAVRESKVVGDIVTHYLRIAPGKLGVTFATDVESATDIARQFNAAGVPAEVVSAKTPALERARILRRFKQRELKQLVNVDLFGEGFDLPAIEVVSMGRPTQSFGLYIQQFGRALRLMEGKQFALIIDHVGNVERHGLPDMPRTWTLDRREKRGKSAPTDVVPVRACPSCTGVYERALMACPFCGHIIAVTLRSGPEQVDGSLVELTPETLAKMRGEIDALDMSPAEHRVRLAAKHMPIIGQMAGVKRHVENQEEQAELRDAIAWWAGHQRAAGIPDTESYKRFYHKFKIDVLSAQALKAGYAIELTRKVHEEIGI